MQLLNNEVPRGAFRAKLKADSVFAQLSEPFNGADLLD